MQEVINDLSTYHESYRQQIIDPVEGAPVSDELVDELEYLVDITTQALQKVDESESKLDEEYQAAA